LFYRKKVLPEKLPEEVISEKLPEEQFVLSEEPSSGEATGRTSSGSIGMVALRHFQAISMSSTLKSSSPKLTKQLTYKRRGDRGY